MDLFLGRNDDKLWFEGKRNCPAHLNSLRISLAPVLSVENAEELKNSGLGEDYQHVRR